VLIDLGRRVGSPHRQRAQACVSQLLARGELLSTSRLNEAELRVGVEMAADRQAESQKVEQLMAFLAVVEFDGVAARRFAALKAHLRSIGRPAGDFDILIAATAVATGQILVTRNPKHFADMPGLRIETY